jgi:hypothetical protein
MLLYVSPRIDRFPVSIFPFHDPQWKRWREGSLYIVYNIYSRLLKRFFSTLFVWGNARRMTYLYLQTRQRLSGTEKYGCSICRYWRVVRMRKIVVPLKPSIWSFGRLKYVADRNSLMDVLLCPTTRTLESWMRTPFRAWMCIFILLCLCCTWVQVLRQADSPPPRSPTECI